VVCVAFFVFTWMPILSSDAVNAGAAPEAPYADGRVGPRGAWSQRHVHLRPQCETPLRQWLDANGLSLRAFAVRLGCSWRTVQNWAAGQAMPSLPYAFRIEEVTAGAVPVASWLGTELGRASWLAVGGKL